MQSSESVPTLSEVHQQHQLHTKWLVSPSLSIGHQWLEHQVRQGHSLLNVMPITLYGLAFELTGPQLLENQRTTATTSISHLALQQAWSQLSPDSYLGRLEPSTNVVDRVLSSLQELRLCGIHADNLQTEWFENAAKADDLRNLLTAYEAFLNQHRLVDNAGLLREAITVLESGACPTDWLILMPPCSTYQGLENDFLAKLPQHQVVSIQHPLQTEKQAETTYADFRAVGETNEVRDVLRRCLDFGIPFDEVELLHTDTATYVPLVQGLAQRFGLQDEESQSVQSLPVTFAEGLTVSLSRPGRALSLWIQWIEEDFPQRIFVEMLLEGLLQTSTKDIPSGRLARVARTLSISFSAERYIPCIDSALQSLGKAVPEHEIDDPEVARREAKRQSLSELRKLTQKLLKLSRELTHGGADGLAAVSRFLDEHVRTINEFDHSAQAALLNALHEQQQWHEQLDIDQDVIESISMLVETSRVLSQSPRPGHLHVSHIHSGGQSGRPHTFIVGLDDRRFPGTIQQDPILLDSERQKASPHLTTSDDSFTEKLRAVENTLAQLRGTVTCSWPSVDLLDDREIYPSARLLRLYRDSTGLDAELETFLQHVGSPVSFTPSKDSQALDESELWLWWLTHANHHLTDQRHVVEGRYNHLRQGSYAQQMRQQEFGRFNGHVPQAGKDLNPFSAASPALSASSLETAGRCPLAYWFQRGLKLYPPEELEIDHDTWLDAAQRGSLLHEVFRRFLHGLSLEGLRPDFERDHQRLAGILEDVIQEWRNAVPPPNEQVFRVQCWQLVRIASIFLQNEEEFCQNSQPTFFEVALGLEQEGESNAIDHESPVAVTLANGGTIKMKGQIDRVDQISKHEYSIWDYKIGSGYGYNEQNPFVQGRKVQSVLYLHMIQQALEQTSPDGQVSRFGYFFPSLRAMGKRMSWSNEELADGLAVVDRLCRTIASGVFLATDHSDDCYYCDYAAICGDVRHVTECSGKHLEKEQIVELKDFRELRHG